MAVSNRELAMTLANEISSRLGRGRHKTHTPAELDELIGEDYWETIGSLTDRIRELKADPEDQDVLGEALDAAAGAKALAYDVPG